MQRVEKLGLEVIELIPFHTHIYLREGHPLAQKEELVMEDLADLPTVRFTQEKDEYLLLFRELCRYQCELTDV